MLEAAEGFQWDAANRLKICSRPGILPCLVEAFFHGRPGVSLDLKHSAGEDRYLAIGLGPAGRWMIAAFTLRTVRGRTLIRPISVRFMHAKEVKAYAKVRPQG